MATGGEVRTIFVDDDYTYMGGSFNYLGSYTGGNLKMTTTNTNIDSNFPFIEGSVYCVVSDGSGGWYVSGSFSAIGGQPRNGLARINANGTVHAWNPQFDAQASINKMIIHDDYLYVSGYFEKGDISVIARYNLSSGLLDDTWNTGLSLLNHDEIGDFTIINNTLFFTGYFYSFHFNGDQSIGKADLINGTIDQSWTPDITLGFRKIIAGTDMFYYIEQVTGGYKLRRFNLTANQTDENWAIGISGGNVTEYLLEDDYIYLFGNFYTINDDNDSFSRTRAAKIIISETTVDEDWKPSFNQSVSTAQLLGNDIFVGGNFAKINNEDISYIAKISKNNGVADENWRPVLNAHVSNLYAENQTVIVNGGFTSAGGHRIKHLARINNETKEVDENWNFNINERVECIIKDGDFLYIGGSFTQINGETRNRLAAIDVNSKTLATHFSPSVNGEVLTMAKGNNQNFFVGGSFSKVNNIDRNRIAKIDITGNLDNQWNADIPDETTTKIHVVVPDNTSNNLYIGGKFSSVGGTPRNNVAVINQTSAILSTWNPNANNSVYAIQPTDNGVFIGGAFTKVQDVDLLYLAKVNGFTGDVISEFAPEITTSSSSGSVNTICQQNDYIYVGAKSVLFEGKTGFAKLNNSNGVKDSDWDIELTQNTHYIQSIGYVNDNIILGGYFSMLSVNSDENDVINFGVIGKSGTTSFNKPHLENSGSWLFPNPFDNVIYVTPGNSIKQILISNLSGQIVLNTLIFEEAKLNTSHLKGGVYLVKLVQDNGNTQVFKMIKK